MPLALRPLSGFAFGAEFLEQHLALLWAERLELLICRLHALPLSWRHGLEGALATRRFLALFGGHLCPPLH